MPSTSILVSRSSEKQTESILSSIREIVWNRNRLCSLKNHWPTPRLVRPLLTFSGCRVRPGCTIIYSKKRNLSCRRPAYNITSGISGSFSAAGFAVHLSHRFFSNRAFRLRRVGAQFDAVPAAQHRLGQGLRGPRPNRSDRAMGGWG